MLEYIKERSEYMFELKSSYKPTGDQPIAIEKLVEGISNGEKNRKYLWVLLEVVKLLLWQIL